MKPVRIKMMEQYIKEREFVSLDTLCSEFGVSKNTVRADVSELVGRGLVEKRYGGVSAVLPDKGIQTYHERQVKNLEKKSAIGARAVGLLQQGDVIFVDSGTTTAAMFSGAFAFPDRITVITNNLVVINQYERFPNVEFQMLPGRLDTRTTSFLGVEAIELLRKFNIKKAFIAGSGISLSGGISNSTVLEAKLKETAVEICEQAILLADSTKIGKSAMINFAELDSIDIWICDAEAREQAEQLCGGLQTRLLFADEE